MINQGDLVVYKYKGLYRVTGIGTLSFGQADRHKQYYTLEPEDGSVETVYAPAKEENPNIRRPVSAPEAEELIGKMNDIDTLWIVNEKTREQEYKRCIFSYRCEDWIKVMKTICSHIRSRGVVTVMDRKYQQMAERALHCELAHALSIPSDDIRGYIEERTGSVSNE